MQAYVKRITPDRQESKLSGIDEGDDDEFLSTPAGVSSPISRNSSANVTTNVASSNYPRRANANMLGVHMDAKPSPVTAKESGSEHAFSSARPAAVTASASPKSNLK